MSKSTEEEKSNWDQVMENFDLLFSQMNDIGVVQQQLKTQMDIRGAAMDQYSTEQRMIGQQVKANGAAVAQLTLQQFDHHRQSDADEEGSEIIEDNDTFHNVFASDNGKVKPESSKTKKPPPKPGKKEALPRQAIPKVPFPKFDGTDPRIWNDMCHNYFDLYQLPEGMWITAATLNFEGNAAKWWQTYKQNHTLGSWTAFYAENFGAVDFRTAMTELL